MKFDKWRLGLAALVLGCCTASQAAVLANSPPDQISGDNMSFALVADDFTLGGLGPYDITNIRFWSIQSDTADYLGTVYWAIYSDATGNPGSVLFSGTPAIPAVATGLSTGFGYNEYVFNIPVTFQLAAGTYWLALQNGSLGSDGGVSPPEMLWETSGTNSGATAGRYKDFSLSANPSWVDTSQEHAFRIDGDRVVTPPPPGVPEPSTLALLLGALLAARAGRREIAKA